MKMHMATGAVERNPGPNGETLTMEDLPVLVKKLKEVAGRWHPLGVQLNFLPGTLDGFPLDVRADPIRALQELFTRWLQRMDPPPTLESLAEAVGGPVIGNELLAKTLLEQRKDFPSVNDRQVDEPTVVIPVKVESHPPTPLPIPDLSQKELHHNSESSHQESLQLQLFDSGPYHYFKKTRIEGIVKVLCLAMFAYHSLAMTLVTMCEDGGFQSVFDEEETMYYEILHRISMFLLRIIVRVVIPAACLAQFTTDIKVPKGCDLSWDQIIEKVLEVCSTDVVETFYKSVRMAQHDIKAMWIIPTHSVLFTGLLLYLGAFMLPEEKMMMEGVCNHKVLTVALPMENPQPLLILECVFVFFTVLLVGITKEFYMYENKIANCAVVIGDEGIKLYQEIRLKWRILDRLGYLIPVFLAGFVAISFASGKPFTPDPPHKLKPADLAAWYFWVVVLSALTFLASSMNLTLRKTCLVSDIIVILFICMNRAIEGVTITPDGDSIIVLLFTIVAVLAFNFLFSLCQCHLYNWQNNSDHYSRRLMSYCRICMCILPLLVIVTAYREITHLAHFIVQ